MGACGSVPKGLKAEVAGAAPPPETPKEGTTIVAPEVAELKAEGGEIKVDGTRDDKPEDNEVATEDKVAEDGDKKKSQDTLTDDQIESKKQLTTATTDAEAVASTTVKAEESEKDKPAPVYDTHSEKEDESEKPSTDIA